MGKKLKRTDYCGNFTPADEGREVTVMGWVDSRRNLGALIFVYLRDRTGLIQLVFDESAYTGDYACVEGLRNEFIIAATGVVKRRDISAINRDIPTGEIEIRVSELTVLSKAETPPFEINACGVRDDLRLKYRYLDLRRPALQRSLVTRHLIAKAARDYFSDNGFIEIETPMLTKSTPEGARDYLVPSRVHKGEFYALPQSPQLLKQLLMISGYDRYMQVARCFRDEDLRADRQPEFTQIDLEMSFVCEDDVMEMTEGFLKYLFAGVMDREIKTPFLRLTYKEAMDRFGSDKPDARFGVEIADLTDIAGKCGFNAFSNAVKVGGTVRAITAPGGAAAYSRKEIDALVEFVKSCGAGGMAWITMKEDGPASSIKKFLSEGEIKEMTARAGAKTGDVVFIVAGTKPAVLDSLGRLRLKVGEKLGLIDGGAFCFLWVTDFPQFEYSEEEGRYVAMHHPFTAPKDECLEFIESDPGKVLAQAYDCVLNGNEIGGGSIRIHDARLQERMLSALGFTPEAAYESFGFLLEALKYGAPPHGGLAFGLDRLAMLITGAASIRDVIAFPKVQNASCLMTGAPSRVDEKQLKELGVSVDGD